LSPPSAADADDDDASIATAASSNYNNSGGGGGASGATGGGRGGGRGAIVGGSSRRDFTRRTKAINARLDTLQSHRLIRHVQQHGEDNVASSSPTLGNSNDHSNLIDNVHGIDGISHFLISPHVTLSSMG
jgi:hypothetical protein